MRAELLPLVREWPRTDQVFITEQGNRQYFADWCSGGDPLVRCVAGRRG
jgi:hypothetical protein